MSAQYDGSIKFDTKIDESKFEKGVSKLKGMAIAGVAGIGLALAGAAVKGGKYALSLASDLQEVQNVVDVTFGDNAKEIEKWSKNAGKSFGMAELAAKQYTGTMGAMLKSMGLSDKEVLKMSTDLTGLAGDFASFYNLDHSAAFDKIRAGISGETEPLKQLGINMSVANLEAYALSQGMKTAYKDMTQAEQATLRYNYILKAGADAQGDFARTSDSFANQLRIAQLSVTEIASSIGEKLLPAATGGMQIINSGLTWLSGAINGNKSDAEALLESVRAQSAAYDEFLIKQNEKTVAQLAEVEQTRRLKDELLTLADANGKINEKDRARVEFILNELNSAYGTENRLINDTITGYGNLSSSIDALIEKKRASILLESAEATYKESINQVTSAVEKQNDAFSLLTQKKNEAVEAHSKVQAGDVAYNAVLLKLQKEIGTLQQAYEEATAEVQQHSTNIQAYEDAAAAATSGRCNEVITILDKMGKAHSEAATVATESAEETKKAYGNAFVDAVLNADVAAANYMENSNEFNRQMLEDAKTKAETAKLEFEKVGGNIVDGIVVGLDNGRENLKASVEALMGEVPEWANVVLQIGSPSKKMAKDTGRWVPYGVAKGIDDNTDVVIDSATNMARAGIDAAKSELDINSPSKVSKDEIGKYIPLGMAKGIEENSDAVIESFDSMLEILEYRRRFDIINEDEYYTELEKLRDKYFKAGTKEWLDYTEKIYSYEQQLLEDEKQRLEEQKKATEKMYDEITDYALDKIGEVEKKQNAYAKKLSSYGGLFEKSTIKFEGQSYDYYALADINADIATIKEYNDLMHQLRDTMDEFGLSDNAKNSLFEEINNLDIDAGKQAMKTLLATNENKLVELFRLYDEKLKFSEGSAAEYYFDEMAEASTQAYQNMVNELEKAGFEIPKGWTASGTLSAKNFGEAFIKEIDVQLAQISSRIDATLAKLKALNTASSNASTIYQDNRTSTISVTVQSPRQAYEVKRANDTYESHTNGW